MKDIFNTYLTTKQYNKIIKYWTYINKISHKIKNFDYSKYEWYEEYSDDEEHIIECKTHNKKLDDKIDQLYWHSCYYYQEYEKYINSIGYELNNRTYDEILFNLLNDGIVLD
jgi:hypothetical protein